MIIREHVMVEIEGERTRWYRVTSQDLQGASRNWKSQEDDFSPGAR
jgi:hypothetical protein